jgi:hypothetical protein
MTSMLNRWGLAATLFVVFNLAAHPASAQPPSLLSDAMLPVGVEVETNETVVRSRAVHVHAELVENLPRAGGEQLAVEFFDDVQIVANFDRLRMRSETNYTWIGSIEEMHSGGWFIMAVYNDAMVANFWLADGRSFEIRRAAEGIEAYMVHELAQENFPQCATCLAQEVNPMAFRHRGVAQQQPAAHGQQNGDAQRTTTSDPQPIDSSPCGDDDDGSLIDVLVVYTPAARVSAGGPNSIAALIHAAVDATNNAYNNSLVETQIRLVHFAETDYQESGNSSTDLHRLRGINNGHMDEVHPLRDEYGADMVALINNIPGSCGVAYLMTNLSPGFESSAFSVTRFSCAVGNLTFAHELGHNMGCAHDRDNAGAALFSYSYGHRWQTTWGATRRSVMAYAPGTRVPHFSNPDVLNGGTPTGVPPLNSNSAHNALSINNAAFTVANWRPSICEPPSNNACSFPIVLSEGTHPFATFGATTTGPVESGCNVQSDIWFGHVVQCTGELTISLCGSSFNTALAVYPFQCPEESGNVLACNTNFCGQQSQVTLDVVADQAIRIRVGGVNGAEGEGVLTISCLPITPPCPEDLNGSGVVDVSDLLMLLGAWGPCDDCPEDINGDGVVDVSDLLMLLGAWGSCE